MAIPLMRKDLRPLYEAARDPHSDAAAQAPHSHPGLLLQRGLGEAGGEGNDQAKADHIASVCRSRPGKFYEHAYARWKRVTKDASRFRSVTLKVESRLFIGLTGGGVLETGCVIGHSHGVPYLPGSGIKGVVSAHARERFRTAGDGRAVVNAHARERLDTADDGKAVCDELFGAPADECRPGGLSGLVIFHDAWWVPGSAEHPLVQEVVTTHHPKYYGEEGRTPATDFDSPVPNAQVAVHGAFLFVLEGPVAWLVLAEQMLIAALSTRGAGARTRTGYGRFAPEAVVAREPRCEWVDTTIADLKTRHRTKEEHILRSKGLAEAWSSIEDPALKRAAFADIRARWQEKGWWDDPPQGRSTRDAKAIYEREPGSTTW